MAQTYEIEINGQVIPFRFGMGFLRKMNERVQVPIDGVPGHKENMGLRLAILEMIDGSTEALLDVLYLANATETPRVTMPALEKWIEEEVDDIDAVFNEVLDFLRKSNCTKKIAENALRSAETKTEEA